MAGKETDGQAIANALKGQTMRIPDLTALFKHWPAAPKNKHYDRLVPFVNDLIVAMLKGGKGDKRDEGDRNDADKGIEAAGSNGHGVVAADGMEANASNDDKRIKVTKKQDLALFTALWFPHVDWETLQTLSYYVIWLFLWDDTVDTAEYDMAHDYARAKEYRYNTLSLFRKFVGGEEHAAGHEVQVDGINRAIEVFGKRLNSHFDADQKDRFLREVRLYIESCDLEHEDQLSGKIPDYPLYMASRLGTSAVNTLCALTEIIVGEALPLRLRATFELYDVWTEANNGVIYINDPLSLRKEMNTHCLINAVSCLIKEGLDLPGAIDKIVDKLQVSVNKLDEAASKLEKTAAQLEREMEGDQHQHLQELVRRYCDACRTMVTATYHFSLQSHRYGIQECLAEDGTVSIPL